MAPSAVLLASEAQSYSYTNCSIAIEKTASVMAVIAVAGGMGQVGRAIVDGLLKHGHKVIVLSRKVLQELSNHD